MEKEIIFSVGDRVTRKKHHEEINGTIKSIDEYGRCYIFWDKKSGKANPGFTGFNPNIGQQHSTLQQKFLKKL